MNVGEFCLIYKIKVNIEIILINSVIFIENFFGRNFKYWEKFLVGFFLWWFINVVNWYWYIFVFFFVVINWININLK